MEALCAAVRLGVEPIDQKPRSVKKSRVAIQAVRCQAAGEIVDDELGCCLVGARSIHGGTPPVSLEPGAEINRDKPRR